MSEAPVSTSGVAVQEMIATLEAAGYSVRKKPQRVPYSDRPGIAQRYIDTDDSYRKIAADYGVTGEAIRQIIKAVDPRAAEKRKARQRREASERQIAAIEQSFLAACRRALEEDRRCLVCDAWVLRGRRVQTCSPECAEAWPLLRTMPEFGGDSHRRHIARSILNNPDSRPVDVKWAKRMLSDDPPPPNRRFLLPNSKKAQALKRLHPDLYAELMNP